VRSEEKGVRSEEKGVRSKAEEGKWRRGETEIETK
jgi:hypothetical protein